jgi:carboxyl-terminal processing protease
MKRFTRDMVCVLLAATLAGPARAAEPAAPATAPAAEVIRILKSRYVDRDQLNDKALSDATVTGILQALGEGATVVPRLTAPVNPAPLSLVTNQVAWPAPLARAEVIDPRIGYIRLAEVTEQAVADLDVELGKFADAQVDGFILDLRFADGTNYTAAAAVATRFLADGQQLFALKGTDRPEEVFKAGANRPAPPPAARLTAAPLLLLVNARTSGSAEALAGALRSQDRGILIGSITAGSAATWEEVPLDDARSLRVATAKIILTPGGEDAKPQSLFPGGLMPDIPIALDLQTEQDVLLNAPKDVTLTMTLQPRLNRKRLTEAELVKAFRGEALEPPPAEKDKDKEKAEGGEPEGDVQVVKDIVLQRAVDVMKGIRVLLSWQ